MGIASHASGDISLKTPIFLEVTVVKDYIFIMILFELGTNTEWN